MKKRALIIYASALLSLIIFAAPLTAMAQPAPRTALNMGAFGALPVLQEGRVKPLASYARLYLHHLSGKERFGKLSATQWLAECLFNPQGAAKQPLFIVDNPELIAMFGLPARKSHLYSLDELAPGLQKTEKQVFTLITSNDKDRKFSATEQSLISLHDNAIGFAGLLKSLTPILPLDITLPDGITLPNKPFFDEGPTYLELLKVEEKLKGKVRDIINSKGEDLDHYTNEEKQTATLAMELELLRRSANNNNVFKIIPSQWDGGHNWYAPPELMASGQGSPQSLEYLMLWRAMAKAYLTDNQNEWDKAVAEAGNTIAGQISPVTNPERLNLEVLYNSMKPFTLALGGYILALLLGSAYLTKPLPLLYKGALTATAFGLLSQISGVAMRIIILGRPPVGSLYESLLYVGAVVAAIALIIEFRRRDARAIIGAAATTAGLLVLAPVVAPNGDNLEVLVAVLNTNFWLATHVICITTGYGVCVLCAALAHIYMVARWREQNTRAKDVQGRMFRTIYITSIAALFFTAFGTILGGIWADQSWGRFWGWDPKENGALLIVLWIIWLHHGRLGGHLSPLAFCAGVAALNIIVALAWFGVNLLSVGLHSYGFTSGIATGLAVFCLSEISIIGGLWWLIRRQKAKMGGDLCSP